ncbi:MAG: cupin domain-containing protein [Parvularculaceae bacterium]
MFRSISSPQALAMALALTTAGALTLVAPSAYAGACPADKVTTDGQKPGATAHKDVSEKLLGSIDLSKEKIAVSGHSFRMRRLDIKPGGEVAWHSHEERPALIYVVSGSITEYSSHCGVPIVHKEGDLSVEQGGLAHWWKNTSKGPVVLISADIAAAPEQPGM